MNSYRVDWYHQVPTHVKEILTRLQKEGFTAYIVGGAVRDLWLKKTPKDFDIASNASTEQIANIFEKTLDIGKKFGIMTVVTKEGSVEIARFRTDGEYTDYRHPESITLANPEEDARRRDFTINALFYDPLKENLIDFVGGVQDLEKRLLRTVGGPEQRFQEDSLRMLRAFRFHAQLGFDLDPPILHATTKLSQNLNAVSRERVTQEMEKIFQSENPFLALHDLFLSGLWEEVFQCDLPNISGLNSLKKIGTHENKKIQWEIYLTTIMEICPTFEIEKAFLCPKEIKKDSQRMHQMQKEILLFPTQPLFAQKEILNDPCFDSSLFLLRKKNPDIKWLDELAGLKEQMEKDGRLNPAPFFTGKDLLSRGIAQGPGMRDLLSALRVAQLNETILSQESAVEFIEKYKKNKV